MTVRRDCGVLTINQKGREGSFESGSSLSSANVMASCLMRRWMALARRRILETSWRTDLAKDVGGGYPYWGWPAACEGTLL